MHHSASGIEHLPQWCIKEKKQKGCSVKAEPHKSHNQERFTKVLWASSRYYFGKAKDSETVAILKVIYRV